MNYDDLHKKYRDRNDVAFLLKTDEGFFSVSTHNYLGGVCDCCRGFNPENAIVKRIVDLKTMEILYDSI